MVADAGGLMFGLPGRLGEEGLGGRIEVAGEHEVLPDEDAECVAGLVEAGGLVASAAPAHVHVRVGGRLQQVARGGWRDAAGQRVGGDPVRAAGEDVAAVDGELEAAAHRVRLGDEADVAQREREDAGPVADGDAQAVDHGLTDAQRLPERGVVQRQMAEESAGARIGAADRDRAADLDAPVHRLLRKTAQADLDLQIDAAGRVCLRDRRPGDLTLGADEPDGAVDADRGERNGPVPAEVALRLAQHVAVRDRAVGDAPRHEIGLCGLQRVGGAGVRAQHDVDAVPPLRHCSRDVDHVLAEG